jgi:hypothetical protein
MSVNRNWSVVWNTIEAMPEETWRGFPLLKPDAGRLVGRIRQKYPTIGQQHIRKGIMFDQERLISHDVVWIRKIGG